MEPRPAPPTPAVSAGEPASRPRGLASRALLGLALLLGVLPFAGGCDTGGNTSPGMMVVDQEKIKAEQDAMRAAQEKAHRAPPEARRKH